MNNGCGEIKYLMAAAVDGEVTQAEQKRLDEHLAACETCAAEYKLIASTQDDLKLLAGVTAPDHLLDKIKQSNGRKDRGSRARRAPSTRRRWILPAIGLAAAATLVFAVVLPGTLMKARSPARARSARLHKQAEGTVGDKPKEIESPWYSFGYEGKKDSAEAPVSRSVVETTSRPSGLASKPPPVERQRFARNRAAQALAGLEAQQAANKVKKDVRARYRKITESARDPGKAQKRRRVSVTMDLDLAKKKTVQERLADTSPRKNRLPMQQQTPSVARPRPAARPVAKPKPKRMPAPPAHHEDKKWSYDAGGEAGAKTGKRAPLKPAKDSGNKYIARMDSPHLQRGAWPDVKKRGDYVVTDANGNSRSGAPISADGQGVTIETREGGRVRVKWDRFTEEDRRKLQRQYGIERRPMPEPDTMIFDRNVRTNPWVDPDHDPKSTFAMDVDTGSYTLVRSYLKGGRLPPFAAVRPEEFVNYFDYLYDAPKKDTFAVHLEAAPTPYSRTIHGDVIHTLRVGIQAKRIAKTERKDAVLVFVIDTSGSMSRENRLGLVKRAIAILVGELGPGDRVGIVEYGSNARKVLDPIGAEHKQRILNAVNGLRARGSTNAEDGLKQGYAMAINAQRADAINRVILLSDGVANVGRTGPNEILKQIQKYVDEGVTLSTVGFGMGNYNDKLMERLADTGNGNYNYVDSIDEARRVFGEQLTGTLQTVAKDAKIQVEFNPMTVRYYRLIGYENRGIADKDFRNDDVDAGEVGAGHSVTALYELRITRGAKGKVATVRVRHENPDTTKVTEVHQTIETKHLSKSFSAASPSFRLAASVAEFAEILRGASEDGDLSAVESHVKGVVNDFDGEKRMAELLDLVRRARQIARRIDRR